MKLRQSPNVDDEMEALERSASQAKSTVQTTLLMAFQDPYLRMPLIIGAAMQMAQQLSGLCVLCCVCYVCCVCCVCLCVCVCVCVLILVK